MFTDKENKRYADIWYAYNVDGDYGAERVLSDEEYISYHIWEDINCAKMYKLYKPDTTVFRSANPNIIFHGGCLGCKSQQSHGIDRCKGCQYFKADWKKPDLSIK